MKWNVLLQLKAVFMMTPINALLNWVKVEKINIFFYIDIVQDLRFIRKY